MHPNYSVLDIKDLDIDDYYELLNDTLLRADIEQGQETDRKRLEKQNNKNR